MNRPKLFSQRVFERDCYRRLTGNEKTLLDYCDSLGISEYAKTVCDDDRLTSEQVSSAIVFLLWRDAKITLAEIQYGERLGMFLSVLQLGTAHLTEPFASVSGYGVSSRQRVYVKPVPNKEATYTATCSIDNLVPPALKSDEGLLLYQGRKLSVNTISDISGCATQLIYSTLRRYPKFKHDDLYLFLNELYIYRGQELSLKGILRLTGIKENTFRAMRNRESILYGDDITTFVDELVLKARARINS